MLKVQLEKKSKLNVKNLFGFIIIVVAYLYYLFNLQEVHATFVINLRVITLWPILMHVMVRLCCPLM